MESSTKISKTNFSPRFPLLHEIEFAMGESNSRVLASSRSKQQRLDGKFMGFDRYLTNKHCHRNSALDSVQHKKASKEGGKSHSKLGDTTFFAWKMDSSWRPMGQTKTCMQVKWIEHKNMITNTKRLKLNISYINRPLRAWGCLHNDVKCRWEQSISIFARGDKYFLREISNPSGFNIGKLKLHVAWLSIPVNLPHLFGDRFRAVGGRAGGRGIARFRTKKFFLD